MSAIESTKAEALNILVLGPMRQTDSGIVTVEDRTLGLKDILDDIIEDLEAETARRNVRIVVTGPSDRDHNVIVSGVLDLIENADLVVLDLSGSRASVAYEVGIVHALGLPYILITSDARPPFYFQAADFIGDFHYAAAFDHHQTHLDLRERVLAFLANPARFAGNQLSTHFGLPLVDIAGPSGLAAGYYRNSIRRFIRFNGFMDTAREVIWAGPMHSKDGVETRRTETRPMTISRFIAVRPPGSLRDPVGHARELADALKKRGLKTEFATIRKREDDFADMRDFGAQFLARITPPGAPVQFIEPGIIVEIPTTLYALPFSPRFKKRLDLDRALRSDRAEQLLQQMLASFEDNLDYHIVAEQDAGGRDRFMMIDLVELPDVLERLGVPGGR